MMVRELIEALSTYPQEAMIEFIGQQLDEHIFISWGKTSLGDEEGVLLSIGDDEER